MFPVSVPLKMLAGMVSHRDERADLQSAVNLAGID